MTLLYLIAIFVLTIILISYIQNKRQKSRLKKISLARQIFTKDDFTKYFEHKGYQTYFSSIVYDEIIKHLNLEKFVLMPDDDLHKICNLDEFGDNELIEKICSQLNLISPDQSILDKLNKRHKNFSPEYILDLIQYNSKQIKTNS